MKMDENFLRYSGLDAVCTMEAYSSFWDQLSPDFIRANDMTMDILPVLMFMQTRGILIDKPALEVTRLEVLESAAKKQEELDALCGRKLNVNSPKDCQAYFYDELGIPAYKTAAGKPTLNDLALQRLVRGTVARPGLRQAKLVQEIRGLNKLYGTYLNLEFDSDGRMRGSYNPRGTKFGRLSSSKTVFGTGTNFQNLPQEFKKFLVADEGYVFVEVDKRQAEWVVVAYVSGDPNMLAAVQQGLDVHIHTACGMFHVEPEIVKRDHKLVGHMTNADLISDLRMADNELLYAMKSCGKVWPRAMSLRQCGKKSNHGLNYDEGYKGFAIINEMDEREAMRIVSMYHALYPGIRIWYESVKRQLQENRMLTNCFGRSVRFLGAWNDNLRKSAYSMIPQSTVVDGLNQGMEAIYEDENICGVSGLNTDIVAQVHDSVLMQTPIAALRDRATFEKFIKKVKEYTSPTMTYNGRQFKIASDFKFGLNWAGYDAETNPFGMQEFEDYDSFIKAVDCWESLNVNRSSTKT